MNINWVIANNAILDPTIKIEALKNVGALWGGWQTYRGFSTDNVVCYDNTKALELISNGFNSMCNFYASQSAFTSEIPNTVKLFGGTFAHEVNNKDEIVALHLCNGLSDVCLLYGFNWSASGLVSHGEHYNGLITELIKHSEVQWVLVDHPDELAPELAILDNITQDTLSNVLKLAG